MDLIRSRAVLGYVLKAAVLVGLAATAVQSVLVPRALYADGAYNLWLVLNTESFVVIGPARTFAILLNQIPVVTAMTLGVRDLDALFGFYTFGVAAVPVLIWLAALAIQLRQRFFWPLVVIYATAFLNSGFIAIGEYTYAFALVALAVSILVGRGALRAWLAVPLVGASVALILCYEGMVFLGLPLMVLALVRLRRPAWLGVEGSSRAERVVLWCVFVCFTLSVAVGGLSIGLRTLNSADTNLAGALNVQSAVETNRQWQVSTAIAVLLLVIALVRNKVVATVASLLVAGAAGVLFQTSYWSPAWLHYNSRSLATFTFAALLVLALLVLVVENRRASRVGPGAADRVGVRDLAFGLAASVLLFSMTWSFWSLTEGYDVWLADLQDVVVEGAGPIDIASTDLYSVEGSQYSWGWTNPYLSALLQTENGQGSVLSHVETLDAFTPISPASSPEFFERYHRTAGASS